MNTIQDGVKPLIPDRRDRCFHATFGSTAAIDREYDADAGFGTPDQNLDGRPFGCTGYAQSELCQDEDKIPYDPGFTYDMTRLVEGTDGKDVGCDVRDSLNTTIVYGVKRKDDQNEVTTDATNHRRGAYYRVDEGPDYFESIRSAMQKYKKLWGVPCSVSVTTRWYSDFQVTNGTGIVTPPSNWNGPYTLHNWKISGWKEINGKTYLVGKPWVGSVLGDRGFFYFPPEVINPLLDFYFSGAFVLAPYTGDFLTVKLTTLEVFISLLGHNGITGDALGKAALLLAKALGITP